MLPMSVTLNSLKIKVSEITSRETTATLRLWFGLWSFFYFQNTRTGTQLELKLVSVVTQRTMQYLNVAYHYFVNIASSDYL